MISEKDKKIIAAVNFLASSLPGEEGKPCNPYGFYTKNGDIYLIGSNKVYINGEEYNQCIEDMTFALWISTKCDYKNYAMYIANCAYKGIDTSNKELLKNGGGFASGKMVDAHYVTDCEPVNLKLFGENLGVVVNGYLLHPERAYIKQHYHLTIPANAEYSVHGGVESWKEELIQTIANDKPLVYTQEMKDNGDDIKKGMQFNNADGILLTALLIGKTTVGCLDQDGDVDSIWKENVHPVKTPEKIKQDKLDDKAKSIHIDLLCNGHNSELRAVKYVLENYTVEPK